MKQLTARLRGMLGNQLWRNTLMLYILQFSNYFFSFVTVPYQTRILGPIVYGRIGVACSVMAYFQLFMDFGFMLSATEDISKNRDDRDYINRKLTSITILKIFLVAISVLAMTGMCIFIPKFSDDPKLYISYLLAFAINSLMPDYLYRGIEKMTAVTVRTVCIKGFCTLLIFVFMRDSGDYLIVPLAQLAGNFFAVIATYIHVHKKLGYRFTKIKAGDLAKDLRRSAFFFVSRIAGTVYSATNVLILGFIDNVGVVTGYYTSADKVVTTAKNCLSPISDSLYPYMVKNKDFKLVKKVLLVTMPVILSGCLFVGFFAEKICVIVFGSEYAGAAPILIALLPLIAATLPSYIFGFPVLGAMGLSKFANTSILVGTIIHLIGWAVLYFTGNLEVMTLACLTSVSEISILIFRIAIVYKNRKIFNGNESKN